MNVVKFILIISSFCINTIYLSAQGELNSFLHNAKGYKISILVRNSFNDVSNMYVTYNGHDLYFNCNTTWKDTKGNTNKDYYKITFDLTIASIYNEKHYIRGSKSVVTIVQPDIEYETINSWGEFYKGGTLINNEIQIDCQTEENATTLVHLLKSLQSGITSADIYNQLVSNFSSLEIMSYDVSKHRDVAYTTNISITFSYPNIIITYTDQLKKKTDYIGLKSGRYVIKIPISDCEFFASKMSLEGFTSMTFKSNSGIEILYDSKITLEQIFVLKVSGFGAERLCAEFNQFRNKILLENYKGTYGISHRSTIKKDTQKPKSILDKYEE